MQHPIREALRSNNWDDVKSAYERNLFLDQSVLIVGSANSGYDGGIVASRGGSVEEVAIKVICSTSAGVRTKTHVALVQQKNATGFRIEMDQWCCYLRCHGPPVNESYVCFNAYRILSILDLFDPRRRRVQEHNG